MNRWGISRNLFIGILLLLPVSCRWVEPPADAPAPPIVSPLQRPTLPANVPSLEIKSAEAVEANLTQAARLVESGQYALALARLKQLAPLTDDPRPQVMLAEIYLAQRRWNLAADRFQQALALEPRHRRAVVGLAEVLLQQQRLEAAAEYWQQAIDLAGNRADGWLGLGRVHLAAGRYGPAVDALRQALAQDFHPDAQWLLAALTLPSDLGAGRDLLAELGPNHAEGAYLLAAMDGLDGLSAEAAPGEVAQVVGIALIQLESWSPAQHALQIAVTADPADPQSWAFLGYSEAMLGLPPTESFARAKALAPESPLPLYFEGIALRNQGDLPQALQQFLTALDLDPGNLGLAVEIARTLTEQGDYLSAEAWYQALVEAEPDSVVYQEFLTTFYVERGYRVGEAGVAAAERLVKLAPESARAYDLLGWARFQAGDMAGAEIALREALTLEPASVTVHYHLGRLLETLQRNIEAEALFVYVVDHDTSGIYRERLGREN